MSCIFSNLGIGMCLITDFSQLSEVHFWNILNVGLQYQITVIIMEAKQVVMLRRVSIYFRCALYIPEMCYILLQLCSMCESTNRRITEWMNICTVYWLTICLQQFVCRNIDDRNSSWERDNRSAVGIGHSGGNARGPSRGSRTCRVSICRYDKVWFIILLFIL